jgi:hypothetical protein
MDDEDTEGFEDLFQISQSSMEMRVTRSIKGDYIPIHLPQSIIEIVKTWTNVPSLSSTSRIGISPCDGFSLDTMFIHRWGETHVEQPYRLTSI